MCAIDEVFVKNPTPILVVFRQHKALEALQKNSLSAQIPLIKTLSTLMYYSRIIALSTQIGPLQFVVPTSASVRAWYPCSSVGRP
jgi:hypothetical protein